MLEGEDDQRRFLKLYGAYEKKMYRVAMSILHSHALAEEAVQQSWLQIIERFEKIKQLPWEQTEGYVIVVAKTSP